MTYENAPLSITKPLTLDKSSGQRPEPAEGRCSTNCPAKHLYLLGAGSRHLVYGLSQAGSYASVIIALCV